MDTTIPTLARRAAAPAPRPGALARLLALLALRRSRLSLAALDARLLRDVGVSRAEALREAGRPAWDGAGHGHWHAAAVPPWDAPAHWLR